MMRMGLTGGIAAGKSTAAQRLSDHGAVWVDHDVLARQVVEPGRTALALIAQEFGEAVLRDGRLDREALGNLVFADGEARRRLNAIVHPEVKAAALVADTEARQRGAAVVVHDIPLLQETGQGGDFDLVVTVAAPVEVRLERLVRGRGLDLAAAQARIASQASDEERAAIADVVLDGGGSVTFLYEQVDALWDVYVTPGP